MKRDDETLSKAEALRQIRLGIRRVALLYDAFAQTLIEEFGKERGFELIRKAIDAYGSRIGREARRIAEEKGLQPVPENFESDLPHLAWETEKVTVEGEERVRVHHCPLAKEWIELGERERGRLYCFVDQAKMKAFNPGYEYLHLKNLLDGDPYCELVVRKA